MDYLSFLDSKSQYAGDDGFEASSLPSFLMGFQADLVGYSLRKGRSGFLDARETSPQKGLPL